jgi:hypothetical protein
MAEEKTFNYIEEEVKEILGPFNMWVTGEEVGHPPSREEAFKHYHKNGGTENFRKKYAHLVKKG